MRILPVVLALLPAALWAEEIPLDSAVSAVTLYPDGATVTRKVPFSAPAGQHELILADLPRDTPLASVRVAVEGARMGRVTARDDYVPPRDEKTDDAVAAARALVEDLERELRDARAEVAAIRLEADAAETRADFLASLGAGEAVAGMDPSGLRDLSAMIGEETLAAKRAALDAGRRAEEADRDLEDLRAELEKARQALRALVPEDKERAMLAVAVTAGEASEGTVTVTYNIRQAGWQPVYDLRLDREAGVVSLERGAFVRQATGENWRDVALTLSTVRPSERTHPSEVPPLLRRIEEPPEPRRGDAGAAVLGLRAAPEPMMVEQAEASFDGLSVTYAYPSPVSVASGADRVRLALGRLDMAATLRARAVPLYDAHAYLMAEVTNDSGELILPAREASFYLDGRFIGKRPLEIIPAGAEAALSFGPIEGVRLRRTVLDRAEGERGIVTTANEVTERVRIEVENLTGETWPVRLIDRVPYSEQEALEIAWSAQPRPDTVDVADKRGVLAWAFDLSSGVTREIILDYALEWPRDKVLR